MSRTGARLVIDAERCQGHNRCHMLAPTLIALDDEGFARLKGDGTVSPGDEDAARAAVRNCPEQALSLEQLDD